MKSEECTKSWTFVQWECYVWCLLENNEDEDLRKVIEGRRRRRGRREA